MWFLWVALGLALLTIAGLYVRRRVVAAAAALGLGARGQRAIRWVALWLLFGYPALVIVGVVVALVFDLERVFRFDGPIAAWTLAVPFFLTALLVLQSLPYLIVVDAVARIRRIPMHRRRAIATLVPVAALAIYTPARILWERGELRWRPHVVDVGDATGVPPFRIVFVADLQQDAHTDAARAGGVMAGINATNPDLVLSGGDWINTGPDHIAAAARSAGLARSRLGTYSVIGDHEHFAYFDRQRSVRQVTEALAAQGVAVLHNAVRRFDHHGRDIAVVFVTYSYPSRTPLAEIDRLIASAEDADVTILVTHQLVEEVAELARDRVDLVLAAHTHGGQVNPLLGVWHLPLARLETPYVDGRYQLGSTTIIVTAGIGYSLVPFRYASPGSVEIVDLVW